MQDKNYIENYQEYPVPSIQRLPVYLRFIKELRAKNAIYVSCTQIAHEFGQFSVQVRKDIAITGTAGRPRIGYEIETLIAAIENFLGWNRRTFAFLVGAGSLGSAILGYQGFVEHGLNIISAFDTDRHKIGKLIHGCPVFHIDQMEDLGTHSADTIEVGILTVPSHVAQDAADKLIRIGVKAIWNYTPIRLDIPDGIICEEVKLSASFAVLSHRLKQQTDIQGQSA